MPDDTSSGDVWERLRRLDSAPGLTSPIGRAPAPGLRDAPVPTVTDPEPAAPRGPDPDVVAPEPLPEPAPAPITEPAPRRRRRWPWMLLAVFVLLAGTAAAGLWYATWRIGQIDRVDVSGALAPATGADVWLVVGTDSREGIDPNRPDAAGLVAEIVPGERADAIMVVRNVAGLGPQILSLPRDLWFDPPGDNNATRINGAYNRGPDALIDLIRDELDIGVQHYVEVDLAGLDNVVDAVGGIDVEVPNPGHDAAVGLLLTEAGVVRMDGAMALAYSRSRKWTDIIDGVEVFDGTGDLGRVERQQAVLRGLAQQASGIRNPLTLNRVVSQVSDQVRLDTTVGVRDLWSFLDLARGATAATPLPVVHHRTGGGAQVLLLGDGAEDALAPFR